ncbi:substrate-binding periplasmic protein [Maridesulfovibrio zosterae]|uniref:substrate-binding periplasmic protein n=1 Tax=Maridesulfovibrio zosterae TaxID=82171 RepID=UPI000409DFE9|nr:transporter substrate-binding domain-containing protein [Maridesulfovibrio zosterae]
MFKYLVLTIFLLLSPCITQARELTIVTLDNTPQAYLEHDILKGFLVDIVKEAARRAGFRVKLKIVPWKRALSMARKGTADAIFNAGLTRERAEYLVYPDVVLITEKVVAFRRVGSSTFLNKDFSSATMLNVGIGRGYYYGKEVTNAIESDKFRCVEMVKDIDLNIKKLLAGRLDIFFGDYYPVMKSLKDNGLLDKIEPISGPETGMPIIYSKSDTYLAFSRKNYFGNLEKISEALKQIKQDGTYEAIVHKYIPIGKTNF